jgi:poly(A) polymerase
MITVKSSYQSILGPVAELISAENVEAFWVGGFVRDALLGRASKDIDLAVNADAHMLARKLADALGASFVSLDADRDVARIVGTAGSETGDDGFVIDVARLDGDINSDLARRDFTVNSIAIPLEAELHGDSALDPHNGRADLQTRTIRALKPDVFRQDPVRLMRAVRLAGSLGFEIEPNTKDLMHRDLTLIGPESPERIREELLATMATTGARDSVRLMDDIGLLSALIPEIDASRNVTQPKEHHYYDVFNHLVETVGFVEEMLGPETKGGIVQEMMPRFDGMTEYFNSDATDMHNRLTLLKLTGLLHDIGKPATKSIEPSGRVRFFEHAAVGEDMAKTVLRRLRFGRKGVRMVGTMIRHHLRPRQMAARNEMPTKRAIHRYFRDVGEVALDTLYLNMADFLAARGPSLTREQMARGSKVIGYILEVGPNIEQSARPTGESSQLLLDGNDIIREFGISPGPWIGRVLSAIAEAEAMGEVNTTEEAIRLATQYLKSEGGGA